MTKSSGGPARREPRPAPALLIVTVALAVAACATASAPPTGPVPSPGSAGAASPPVDATAVPASSPAAPSSPVAPATTEDHAANPGTDAGEPPLALLLGTGAGEATGDLGSFSWDGLTSDSPWIVQRRGSALAPGGRPRVRFDGDAVQESWSARWARIIGADAGRPRAAGRGGADAIVVDAPPGPGAWSLRLEVTFGEGRRATWYWRVQVSR